MGSKTGKYAFDKKISLHDSEEKKQSKNDELSLPKLIHQDSLSNISSSSNNGNLTLVWLDPELNNQPANIDVQIKLKNLIGYLRTFTDIPTCEQYIEQIGEMNDNELLNGEKLFLIIPPELSFAMIPNIHDFPQVKYIYIYGLVKMQPKVTELAITYSKVKGIFPTCQGLLAQIARDQNE